LVSTKKFNQLKFYIHSLNFTVTLATHCNMNLVYDSLEIESLANISFEEREAIAEKFRIQQYNEQMPLQEFLIFMSTFVMIAFLNSIFRAYLIFSRKEPPDFQHFKSTRYFEFFLLIRD
jgi:hypothetical protein